MLITNTHVLYSTLLWSSKEVVTIRNTSYSFLSMTPTTAMLNILTNRSGYIRTSYKCKRYLCISEHSKYSHHLNLSLRFLTVYKQPINLINSFIYNSQTVITTKSNSLTIYYICETECDLILQLHFDGNPSTCLYYHSMGFKDIISVSEAAWQSKYCESMAITIKVGCHMFLIQMCLSIWVYRPVFFNTIIRTYLQLL